MPERSDAYIVGRLIKQTKLLLATDETIPSETKLQAQAMLKEFQAAVAQEDQDEREVRSQYAYLYRELSPYPDLEALLSAMRTFVRHLD